MKFESSSVRLIDLLARDNEIKKLQCEICWSFLPNLSWPGCTIISEISKCDLIHDYHVMYCMLKLVYIKLRADVIFFTLVFYCLLHLYPILLWFFESAHPQSVLCSIYNRKYAFSYASQTLLWKDERIFGRRHKNWKERKLILSVGETFCTLKF